MNSHSGQVPGVGKVVEKRESPKSRAVRYIRPWGDKGESSVGGVYGGKEGKVGYRRRLLQKQMEAYYCGSFLNIYTSNLSDVNIEWSRECP